MLFLVCACGVAWGQGTTSRVLGTVQDATGTVVPAADVKFINQGTRITFTAKTSAASGIRADATNLTNSVSFNAPTTDIRSSIFGRIRNSVASRSRKIQLGVKVYF